MERSKVNWRDKFIGLGYSDKQVSELLKYPLYVLQGVHERGYINTGMNCGQIKQIMLGLNKNHLSVFVKDYAKNEYSTAHMRVIRLLLNIGLESGYIAKYMDPKEFNHKQCFVLGMVLINSKEVNIDVYLEFIRNADRQVDGLYRLFIYRVSGFQYDRIQAESKRTDIMKCFDMDFYSAQIDYQMDLVPINREGENV